MDEESLLPPEQNARWCYALEGKWQNFSDEDDAKLEKRWASLEKDGQLAKLRKRRDDEKAKQRQEEEEDEEEDEYAEEQQSSGDGAKFIETPSGVDKVRKGMMDVIGQGPGEIEKKALGQKQGKDKQGKESAIFSEQLDPDEPEEDRKARIEVMEDHLFEVDLVEMRLFPVFWKGVMLKVVRAKWFYSSDDEGHAPIPYEEDLSKDLDNAYDEARPWESNAKEGGKEQSEKAEKMYKLPSMENQGEIQFDDPSSGCIFTQDLTGKLRSVLGGSRVTRGWTETVRRAKDSSTFFQQSMLPWAAGEERKSEWGQDDSNGTQTRSRAASAPDKAPATNPSSGKDEDSRAGFFNLWPSTEGVLRPGVNLLRAMGWSKGEANREGQRASKQKTTEKSLKSQKDEKEEQEDDDDNSEENDIPTDRKDEPPELILVIHGIGQKMAEEWTSLDFELDVERFRNVSKKMAMSSALKQVSRGKRAQYLPICWRKGIDFDQTETQEGSDNVYTLEDVSNSASIPLVRNVITKVIVDVPYYLSRHKDKMIQAVKAEVNRVYRLFVRRNPDFEKKGGRVSLICHSLGSAIAADILSQQPTVVPPLNDRTREDLDKNEHFLFNVKSLIFVGSPNGFFFHLEGAQMIARRGTARTKNVAADAARDEVGRYGCMAAESVYNCYNTTDPVAFQLSPTVDAQYARTLNPISIPDAVPALLEALRKPRLSLSKLFDPKHPFNKGGKPAYVMESKTGMSSPSQPDSGVNTPKRSGKGERKTTIMLEEGNEFKRDQIKAQVAKERSSGSKKGGKEAISVPFDLEKLQRAERRFRALNPHGVLDFQYDSGGYNQYFDMLGAHVSYWTSSSFATFVLLQVLADYSEEATAAPTIVPEIDLSNLISPGGGKGTKRTSRKSTFDVDSSVDEEEEREEDEQDADEHEEGHTVNKLLAALSPSGII